MTSIKIDRLDGLSSATAIKGPCRVATTGPAGFIGLPVIDGIQTERGDRVLVKDEADQRQNGIWIADTGPWRRAADFSRNDDVRKGTVVHVTDGEENRFTEWFVISENQIVIDKDDIVFEQSPLFLKTVVTPFSGSVEAGSDDEIDLGNDKVLTDGLLLFLDGVYQHPGTYTLADGVISPIGAWPGSSGTIEAAIWYLSAGSLGGSVPSGSVDRSKLRVNFKKSTMLAPQEYGARGDGGDDTDSLVEWAAACQHEKLQPYLPQGDYTCGAALDFSTGGGVIRGAGEGLAVLRFTNPLSGGIKCHPVATDVGPKAEGLGVFSVENLTLRAAPGTVIPRAIDFVLPDNGRWSNQYRGGFRNIEILGEGSGYFGTGLRERNVSYSDRQSVKYWGSVNNPTAQAGYFAGVGFDFDTQMVDDNPLLGISLENRWYGCTANFCDTAVKVRGFPEGMYLHGSNFAYVRKGIDAVAQGGTRQPLVNVIGNHINATEACMILNGFGQSQVLANHTARPDGLWAYQWVGLDLINSLETAVIGNQFRPEAVLSGSGDQYGVRLSGDSWFCVVDANHFAGAIDDTGTYKKLTAGILINAGVNATKIGDLNQYTNYYDTPIIDNSGNSTNLIPGVTVQLNGVTQGTSDKIKTLNFSSDFTVSVSGGAATIGLA